jgi:hypothetical protein
MGRTSCAPGGHRSDAVEERGHDGWQWIVDGAKMLGRER